MTKQQFLSMSVGEIKAIFNNEQYELIMRAIDRKMDVDKFLDARFNVHQMRVIRDAMSELEDVSVIANPEFPSCKMRIIYHLLRNDRADEIQKIIPIEKDENFWETIRPKIVWGNLTIEDLTTGNWTESQLELISRGRKLKFDIVPYFSRTKSERKLKSILTLEHKRQNILNYIEDYKEYKEKNKINLDLELEYDQEEVHTRYYY